MSDGKATDLLNYYVQFARGYQVLAFSNKINEASYNYLPFFSSKQGYKYEIKSIKF